MNLSEKFAEVDHLGRPRLSHRPLQHCHVPGGGMWTVASTVQMDFLTFITGQPFAKIYDTFSAVSAGAINTVAALLPRHKGSTEPLHPNFIDIRTHLIEDGRKIFEKPSKKLIKGTTHENFFLRRLLRDLWGGVNHLTIHALNTAQARYTGALGALSDSFDPARDKKKDWGRKGLRALATWATDTPDFAIHGLTESLYLHQRDKVSRAIDQLANWLEDFKERNADRAHFDHRVLLHHLRNNYRVDIPGTGGEKHDAQINDLIAPIIIPAIRTNDDQHARFVRAPASIQDISAISDYVATLYHNGEKPIAQAVLYSCLQPTMFRTAKDTVTGHDYSDGGSNYTARRGVNDILRMYANGQPFSVAIYECSLKNRPTYTNPKNLGRSHLLNEVAAMSRLHLNATGSNDMQDIIEDPRCRAFHYFKRPMIYHTPPVCDGPLHDQIEEFSQKYVGMSLDECLNTRIPDDLPDITQAATSPEMVRIFMAAGVQAVMRNLPEMVAHAKDLIINGPISDRLSANEQADLLTNIDTRFPPTLLEEVKAARAPHTGFNSALHVTSYYRQQEAQPSDNVRRLQVVGGAAPQA